MKNDNEVKSKRNLRNVRQNETSIEGSEVSSRVSTVINTQPKNSN